MNQTPPVQFRPKLHGWLVARRMGASDLARRWAMTPQAARKYLLPFGDGARIIPNEGKIADVLQWTAGEVGAADWYPPELSRNPLPASIGDPPRAAGAVQ